MAKFSAASKTPAAQRHRVWLKRAFLVFATPAFALLLTEGVLVLAGAFEPIRILLPVIDNGRTIYRTNPSYGTLFLPRANIPSPSPIWVAKDKPHATTRVVLLGESAAAGFPHPEFNLARVIEHVWMDRYPDKKIEVVNLTMVAVNSHILRLFAREAVEKLDPDLFVILAGHNEAIGPYGPASVFGKNYSLNSLIRFNLFIRNTRVGRALQSFYNRIPLVAGSFPRWTGLDEFRDAPIEPTDARLKDMEKHFSVNLNDILELAAANSVKCLVFKPPVNLADWPPLRSTPEQVAFDEALHFWEREGVSATGLVSAWQCYQMARHYQQAGNWTNAWALYRLANDLDHYRFRADQRIREVIDSVVKQRSSGEVRLIDLDRILHEENPTFVTDRDFFCEHVHLTYRGRFEVAQHAVTGVADLLTLPPRPPALLLSHEELGSQMLFTPVEERVIWTSVRDLLSLPVFQGQPERQARLADIESIISGLTATFTNDWSVGRFYEAYSTAITLFPDDALTYFVAARNLRNFGDAAEAEKALRKGLAIFPAYPQAWQAFAEILVEQRKFDEALTALDRADEYSIDLPLVAATRGLIYGRQNRLKEARDQLEHALKMAPGLYGALVICRLCMSCLRTRKTRSEYTSNAWP